MLPGLGIGIYSIDTFNFIQVISILSIITYLYIKFQNNSSVGVLMELVVKRTCYIKVFKNFPDKFGWIDMIK